MSKMLSDILNRVYSFLEIKAKPKGKKRGKYNRVVEHTNKYLVIDELLESKPKHNFLCLCYAKCIKLKKVKGKSVITAKQIDDLKGMIDNGEIRGEHRIAIISFLAKCML